MDAKMNTNREHPFAYPYDLVRLDAALVKRAAWNGFAKARVLFGRAVASQHARPVFSALGCDNLHNAR
jgi:hypothetical protein